MLYIFFGNSVKIGWSLYRKYFSTLTNERMQFWREEEKTWGILIRTYIIEVLLITELRFMKIRILFWPGLSSANISVRAIPKLKAKFYSLQWNFKFHIPAKFPVLHRSLLEPFRLMFVCKSTSSYGTNKKHKRLEIAFQKISNSYIKLSNCVKLIFLYYSCMICEH
jgi:hypothetical protein